MTLANQEEDEHWKEKFGACTFYRVGLEEEGCAGPQRRIRVSQLAPEGLSPQPPLSTAPPTQDPAVTAEAM